MKTLADSLAKTHCAPKVAEKLPQKSRQDFFTCFNFNMLVVLARLYNENHGEDKIHIPSTKAGKKRLWQSLHDKLHPVCGDNEACWIERDFVVKRGSLNETASMSKSLKPKKPEEWKSNPREWLNTYNILHVMKQFEESDPKYHFVGVMPVDARESVGAFNKTCIVPEMCRLNLTELWDKGVRKIGVVFNLDRHDQSGSHWTSVFIGLSPRSKNFGVFYYDSVAMKPPKEIVAFMEDMSLQLISLHPTMKKKVVKKINKVRRQYGNTECGVFSMLFQIMMMKYSFVYVCKNMGYDKEVAEFREVLYRK